MKKKLTLSLVLFLLCSGLSSFNVFAAKKAQNTVVDEVQLRLAQDKGDNYSNQQVLKDLDQALSDLGEPQSSQENKDNKDEKARSQDVLKDAASQLEYNLGRFKIKLLFLKGVYLMYEAQALVKTDKKAASESFELAVVAHERGIEIANEFLKKDEKKLLSPKALLLSYFKLIHKGKLLEHSIKAKAWKLTAAGSIKKALSKLLNKKYEKHIAETEGSGPYRFSSLFNSQACITENKQGVTVLGVSIKEAIEKARLAFKDSPHHGMNILALVRALTFYKGDQKTEEKYQKEARAHLDKFFQESVLAWRKSELTERRWWAEVHSEVIELSKEEEKLQKSSKTVDIQSASQ